MNKGKLYIIPTPIGNLEDITLRALRLFKEVDILLAEDTRTTGFLLKHYEISVKKLYAYHKFNEHKSIAKLVETINEGLVIGLVSDAGTPGISDPGFLIVRECVQQQIEVECLPGATALIPALVASGIPCDRFYFEGFLPQKKGRQTRFKYLKELDCTIVLYESPHRIKKTLEQLAEYFGENRYIALGREISKKFEQIHRDSIEGLIEFYKTTEPKGEFVVVISNNIKEQNEILNKLEDI